MYILAPTKRPQAQANSNAPARSCRHREFAKQTPTRPQGRAFTLLEMLLVLAILAILAAVVALAFTDSGRHRHLRAEAERLARLVELARDEALRGNEIWGLAVTEGRYGFQRYDHAAGNWSAVARPPFRAVPSEEAVTFRIAANAAAAGRLAEQFAALEDNVGFQDAAGVRHTAGNSRAADADPPSVAVFPDGEVTPFEVTVFLDGTKPHEEQDHAWLVFTDGIARVRALSVQDAATDHQRRAAANLDWP